MLCVGGEFTVEEMVLTLNIEVQVEVVAKAYRGEVVEEVVQSQRVLQDRVQGKLEQLSRKLPRTILHRQICNKNISNFNKLLATRYSAAAKIQKSDVSCKF